MSLFTTVCSVACMRSGPGLDSRSESWSGLRKREEDEDEEEELGTRQERGNICLLRREEVEGGLLSSSFIFSACRWRRERKSHKDLLVLSFMLFICRASARSTRPFGPISHNECEKGF